MSIIIYKFADYKEQVYRSLYWVGTVSLKTMAIVQQMPDIVEHRTVEAIGLSAQPTAAQKRTKIVG